MIKVYKHTFNFKFSAKTSRGTMLEKESYFIKIYDQNNSSKYGIGEIAPLPGLSIDDINDFENILITISKKASLLQLPQDEEGIQKFIDTHIKNVFPSIRFGYETAFIDLIKGGKRLLFDNGFTQGKKAIPINGLIWMGNKEFMLKQIKKRMKEGYSCLKMKIGAIDFDQEYELLYHIRSQYSSQDLILRVDANGAFNQEDVFKKLEKLSNLNIHSIEQPTKPYDFNLLGKVIKNSPIPVALDEQLIGVNTFEEKRKLLDQLSPHFLVLKPTLIGGFSATKEWISLAQERNMDWWVTSALESNVGLNAISQFVGQFNTNIPQGLGTGKLFHENFHSPLVIKEGSMYYDKNQKWADFSLTRLL